MTGRWQSRGGSSRSGGWRKGTALHPLCQLSRSRQTATYKCHPRRCHSFSLAKRYPLWGPQYSLPGLWQCCPPRGCHLSARGTREPQQGGLTRPWAA